MQLLKRSRKLAVLALAVVIVPTLAFAHHQFHRWWLKPPAVAVADVTIDPVTVSHASLSQFSVLTGVRCPIRAPRLELTGTPTTATVVGGVLTIGEIKLADTTGATTAVVTLKPASLVLNCFGSQFQANGEAVVTVTDLTTDPATVVKTVTVPVHVCGQINTDKDGAMYLLRAKVQGALSVANADKTGYDVTVLCLDLDGTAAVPPPPTTTTDPAAPTS